LGQGPEKSVNRSQLNRAKNSLDGPNRWKNWKRFDKKGIIRVLNNAVNNRLVEKKWLEMATKL
jgi:hypothetical protein